jgi:hypothetical protein
MDSGKIRLITVAGAVTAIVGVEYTARVPVAAGLCSPAVAILGARLLETVLILALIRFGQSGLDSVGLGKKDIRRGLRAGLAWSIIFGGVVAVAGALLMAAGVNPVIFFRLDLPAGSDGVLYLFIGTVISPFAEELFFRGVLYGFFRRLGVAAGIILTSIIFAGLHLPGRGIPLTQLAGGVVFCLAYEKEESLMAPYVIHVLGNAAIFTLGALG